MAGGDFDQLVRVRADRIGDQSPFQRTAINLAQLRYRRPALTVGPVQIERLVERQSLLAQRLRRRLAPKAAAGGQLRQAPVVRLAVSIQRCRRPQQMQGCFLARIERCRHIESRRRSIE
jgi:hypothetical protein